MKKEAAYKGHEIFRNTVRISFKMYFNTFLWILVLHLLVTVYLTMRWYGEDLVSLFKAFFHDPGKASFGRFSDFLVEKTRISFMFSALVWLLYPMVIRFFERRAKKQGEVVHLRGAQAISPSVLNKAIKSNKEEGDLKIGEVQFPKSAEVKHALAIGRPGAGKTVLLSGLLERLINRGERGIIYDFKGDYVSRFYRPDQDLLFNPVDERCLSWNIFNEIKTVTDIDAIAHSLIPASHGEPFWNDGARDVFSGLLHRLYQKNQKSNADIWKAISAPGKEISGLLQGAGAERGFRYVEDGGSKQTMSILSVMMQYAKCFELLSKLDGDFQIAEWLKEGAGWIFVTNDSEVADTLRPMVSLFIDLVGRRLLSLKDDPHRRVFFFIDEFGTLQPLSTIVQLLTLSRSKGGSVWLGIQDIGQIDKIYGEPLRQAIVNACGTAALFSVSDPQTATFLTSKIGEREFLETEETYSMGVAKSRDGVSLMRRRKVENLILPSQIMGLKDLELFLQIPSYDLTKTSLTWKEYPVLAEPLCLREDLKMDQRIIPPANPKGESLQEGDDRPKQAGLDYDLDIEEDRP